MLYKWKEGNQEVLDELVPIVYRQLHKQAAYYLRKERRNHTLQTSGLIHEAYIKLVDQKNVQWESRTHFFAIAAMLMRQILVDYAREKRSLKRGGNVAKVPLSEVTIAIDKSRSIDLIELDEALIRLKKIDERKVKVVELRYFSGLTLKEIAKALSISRTTAAEDWSVAKAWLYRELTR